jgi:glycosyltransferase involved in cell wall biosynthesis
MESKGKVLFLTTIDVTIYAFLIPHMELLKDMGYEVEAACSNVGFTERIEEEGFKVYNLPFSRNPFDISNIKAVLRLYQIMKANNYVMLHTHTPVASFMGRIVGKIVGIPNIVYTVHGFHFHEYGNSFKNFVYFRLEKFAGRFTDVLITINNDDYKVAVEKKIIPNGKVVYIKGVGVDTEKFDPEKVLLDGFGSYLYNFSGTTFISVGRLDTEKHFDHLLKAFSLVKQKRSDFRFLIVGDGPEKDHLKRMSVELDLRNETEFMGYVKGVERFLKISNIFIFASSREGLPVSLMEAMAMEKPVVAYNIRGVRDLVEDGVNGFLVPFGDIEAFTEKIIYLMDNLEVAKEMGKRGREKILKEFSLDKVIKDMKKLYKEILEDGRSE